MKKGLIAGAVAVALGAGIAASTLYKQGPDLEVRVGNSEPGTNDPDFEYDLSTPESALRSCVNASYFGDRELYDRSVTGQLLRDINFKKLKKHYGRLDHLKVEKRKPKDGHERVEVILLKDDGIRYGAFHMINIDGDWKVR